MCGLTRTPALCQVHPPQIDYVFPLSGFSYSQPVATNVTAFGSGLEGATSVIVDRPDVKAEISRGDLPGDQRYSLRFIVSTNAKPGIASFRIVTDHGVSSVGKWLVRRDIPEKIAYVPVGSSVSGREEPIPVALNGAIQSLGQQDSYVVSLEAGKTFVAQVDAAVAGSPLDSLLTVTDPDGHVVAENDDYNGSDSLIAYPVKKSGKFTVTISSAVETAGPDQVYTLSLGYFPVLTALFPASPDYRQPCSITPVGINVPADAKIAWKPGDSTLLTYDSPDGRSNALSIFPSGYTTTTLTEPIADRARAVSLTLPAVVNGRFYRADGKPGGDTDWFRFHADAGQRLIIDAQSQALGARADTMLTLYDAAGKVVEENDDTFGTDARIDRAMPATGDYRLRLKEARGHVGPGMVYRLVFQGAPPPTFSMSADTRARVIGKGDSVPVDVNVARIGYVGPVTLSVKDLPAGVTASSCVVAPEVNRGLLVLTADATAKIGAFPLHIVGTGTLNGKPLVLPLDNGLDSVWRGARRVTVPSPANLMYMGISAPFESHPTTDTTQTSVAAGAKVKVKVRIERRVTTPMNLKLRAVGLPDNVTATDAAIPGDKSEAEIEIDAAANARPGTYPIAISCVYTVPGSGVELDRVTEPIQLTITAVMKK